MHTITSDVYELPNTSDVSVDYLERLYALGHSVAIIDGDMQAREDYRRARHSAMRAHPSYKA